MAEQSGQARTRRFRLKPQFSMQTLLLLMLVAALVCAWLLAPRLEESTLGGGALRTRAQWSQPVQVAATLPPGESSERYLHGRWLMYDRHGRKLIQGTFRDGKADGPWRYFDTGGNEVLRGTAHRGHFDGLWTVWHVNGRAAQQVSFARWDPRDAAGEFAQITHFWDADRTGSMRQAWDDGQTRVAGQFAHDRRDGQWTWFDRQGKKIAEGAYRRGRRQGEWRRWDAADDRPVVGYFADGARVDDLDDLLGELAADLRSDQVRLRSRAAWGLERIGLAAVPVLREALRDGDPIQRLLAIRSLKQIGPDAAAAQEELEAAARTEGPRTQLSALIALAEIDPPRAEPVVERLLQAAAGDDNDPLAARAIDFLVRAGPAMGRCLVAAVHDERPEIRLAAFEVITRIEHKYREYSSGEDDPNLDTAEMVKAIHDASDHPDEKIRELAATLPYPWNAATSGGFF